LRKPVKDCRSMDADHTHAKDRFRPNQWQALTPIAHRHTHIPKWCTAQQNNMNIRYKTPRRLDLRCAHSLDQNFNGTVLYVPTGGHTYLGAHIHPLWQYPGCDGKLYHCVWKALAADKQCITFKSTHTAHKLGNYADQTGDLWLTCDYLANQFSLIPYSLQQWSSNITGFCLHARFPLCGAFMQGFPYVEICSHKIYRLTHHMCDFSPFTCYA
jgi:hypothetical protein